MHMLFDFYQDLIFFNGGAWDRYFPSRADERKTYDVIVIGSGMGGGILGNETSNRGKKTLILEAGPIRHLVNVTDLPVPNVPETIQPYELADGTELRGGLCFNVGGRSIFWSAVIPRMREWELRHWPQDIADYLRDEQLGYARAETLFRIRREYPPFQDELVDAFRSRFSDHYEVTPLPRSLHQPDSKQNPLPGNPDARSTGVFSTAALLAESLNSPGQAGSEYLDVAVEHFAVKLLFDGTKAVGVEVLDLRDRCRRTFRGEQIVLACGTIESARLALTSGLVSPGRGADDIHYDNLIGRGLTDHPEASVGFEIPQNWSFGDGDDDFTADDQGNIFLRPKDSADQDLFSCELALNWKFWDVRMRDDQLFRQQFAANPATTSTIKFLFRNGLCDDNVLTVGDRYQIQLAPMAIPEATMKRAQELANGVRDYFGLDPKSFGPLTVRSFSDTAHLAGSLRMGEDPERSVVDLELKFHGYDNLYCCDLSVFPDIPASNPSLTLGALALRLADKLAAVAAAQGDDAIDQELEGIAS